MTFRCGGYRCSSLSTRLNWLNNKLENPVSRSSPTLVYDGEVNNMYLFFSVIICQMFISPISFGSHNNPKECTIILIV